eukprot:TRINITY_DN20628_c0_g1_i1.p2 TRINITY_DN20628_c0_g1~~TRINITY_DN20628_c0_g1_i1.p2  ORF type:complete len:130 (+),score=12.19 TRINITY_DN20628_c0_g1_i1:559-948(+)
MAPSRCQDMLGFKRAAGGGRSKDMPSQVTPTTHEAARPTTARDHGPARAVSPELRPQLKVCIMQDKAPREVKSFTHMRTQTVRLLYTPGHIMPAPEPALEVDEMQKTRPKDIQRFTHHRSRTAYVRDGR